MSQKIFIKTFGCQMNEYDSNRIYDAVKKIGFIKTDKYQDALAGIKVIKKFSDKNEKLKFISASFDKKVIEFKEFEALAKLPSLEELRAKIVGYITAPHQKLISVLNAPATETAGVIENYSKKK